MSAADLQVDVGSGPGKPQDKRPARPRRPNYNHIHRNLLPIEVYPLPTLIPHNPLSLLAIALSYLVQVLVPPQRPTYNGYFSSATSSIHITDHETIRKLWEMGFFGKGSLSRSEPNWLEAQKRKGSTAEENTGQRREERRRLKLERARLEQEVIAQELSREVELQEGNKSHTDGNVPAPLKKEPSVDVANGDILKTNAAGISDITSVLQTAKPDEHHDSEQSEGHVNGTIHGYDEWRLSVEVNGVPTPPPTSTSSEASQAESRPVKKLQRQKTVRFSPTIEAREFDLSSPVISPIKSPGSSPLYTPPPEEAKYCEKKELKQQEHLQLSLEEAFFLSYSLGVLQVYCDDSDTVLPPTSLLSLLRRHSYQPARSLSISAEPDDSFMVSYAAYHHYRSLGWVVRSGVKFAVDYLLYNRGPAFSHAEFAVVVIPSYTHPYWSEGKTQSAMTDEKSRKSWWWLHGINRVQAQVKKQLILCYVDIPPPLSIGQDFDIAKAFARYKVRDVSVRRWSPNRTRD